MDDYVPEAFIQVATCFALDYTEDGEPLAVVSTTSGQVLEFVDKEVINSYDLDREAHSIKVFTSYDPVQKFYIIQCDTHLTVLKRGKPMTVVKTYENVTQVNVEDRLCLGRPQAVIMTLTDEEPIVTDFVSQLRSPAPHPVPALTLGLSGKLQEMNFRLEKARQLLQEKRTTRVQTLHQLTPHLKPPDSQPQAEPKVLAWGPPFPQLQQAPLPPLKFAKSWQHVHNGKWVIGLPVFNTSDTEVVDVRLRLQMDGKVERDLQYETLVVAFPQGHSIRAVWTEPRSSQAVFATTTNIPGHTSAIIVGVLEEPLFKKSSEISVSGAVLYSLNSTSVERFQDILETVVLKVEDLLEGVLQPFGSQDSSASESDLVSVAVTSDHLSLRVSTVHGLPGALDLAAAGLREIPALNCWVGNHRGSLQGVLVMQQSLSGSEYELELYARDVKQALQFVHSFRSQWRVELRSEPSVTLSDCTSALAAELRFLLRMLQPNVQFTVDRWAELRQQLGKLELATDKSFTSYLPPKN